MKRMKLLLPVLLIITLCSFAAADWVVIQKKDAGFKISFPKNPEESNQDMPTDIGKITMHTLMYNITDGTDENMTYGLIYMDYPADVINSDLKQDQLDLLFKSSIDGGAKNIEGKVVSIKNVTYKGYPGRLAKISFSEGILNMKMYLVKNRMYIMESGSVAGKDNNKSTDKFFGSFELLTAK